MAVVATLLVESGTLVAVTVPGCQIGVAGASALADALRANRTLTLLDVGSNAIGDAGSSVLFDALTVNCTLTALNTGSCEIQSTAALADALGVNRTLAALRIGGNELLFDAGFHELTAAISRPGCPLEVLDLAEFDLIDDDTGRDLGCDINFTWLGKAVRALARAMAANTSLTAVTLSSDVPLPGDKKVFAITERNRQLREQEVVLHEFLRSPAGLEAVPWIPEEVLANVAEYAGRGWSDLELALRRRWGSPFVDELADFFTEIRGAM